MSLLCTRWSYKFNTWHHIMGLNPIL